MSAVWQECVAQNVSFGSTPSGVLMEVVEDSPHKCLLSHRFAELGGMFCLERVVPFSAVELSPVSADRSL